MLQPQHVHLVHSTYPAYELEICLFLYNLDMLGSAVSVSFH